MFWFRGFPENPLAVQRRPMVEEAKMFIGEVLRFWLLVGVGFSGLRRLANGKGFRSPRAVAPSNRRRRQNL